MIESLLNAISWISPIGANPVVVIYQSLAAVHAFAALYHLKLEEDRAMAFCYGLVSMLYLLLAMHYGVAH